MPAPFYPLVYPNPFHVLDHEGQCCGTFPFSPEHANGSRRWVGATIATATFLKADLEGAKALPTATVAGKREYVGRVPDQRTLWLFDLTPQPVLATPASLSHYRMGVRDGALFPADPESAKALGVAFTPPLEALAAARDEAAKAWRRDMGTDAPVADWPALPSSPPSAPASQTTAAPAATAPLKGAA